MEVNGDHFLPIQDVGEGQLFEFFRANVPPGLSAVFLGTQEGTELSQNGSRTRILAVDALTGETKWEYLAEGALTFAPLLLANDLLYHGNINGKLIALNANTGILKMERQLGGFDQGDGITRFGVWITALSMVDNRLMVSVMPLSETDPVGVVVFGLP